MAMGSRASQFAACEPRGLVVACVRGDHQARRAFQARFANDIYNFATRIHGLSDDLAADFYLYAFDEDRIFARLTGFDGGTTTQLRTFLAYYVLRGLHREWERSHQQTQPGATMHA